MSHWESMMKNLCLESVDPGESKPSQGLGLSLDGTLTFHCRTYAELQWCIFKIALHSIFELRFFTDPSVWSLAKLSDQQGSTCLCPKTLRLQILVAMSGFFLGDGYLNAFSYFFFSPHWITSPDTYLLFSNFSIVFSNLPLLPQWWHCVANTKSCISILEKLCPLLNMGCDVRFMLLPRHMHLDKYTSIYLL